MLTWAYLFEKKEDTRQNLHLDIYTKTYESISFEEVSELDCYYYKLLV